MKKIDCLIGYRERINHFLATILLSITNVPTELHEAIQYVVLGGGKRVRAALVYATGEALGAELAALDYVAAAVELIHVYSLVHDDLPAMDDDDLRHGKATCHKVFGEAIAILTGDALQTLAFEILAKASEFIAPERIIKMLLVLAQASGVAGMVGGQVLDLAAEGKSINLVQLEAIHQHKTGALITASVQLGTIAADCVDVKRLDMLKLFGQTIGLAFQIQDDILDIESSTQILGKKQGADLTKNKATYPALIGVSAAKEKLAGLYQQALQYLAETNLRQGMLHQLTTFIIQRNF